MEWNKLMTKVLIEEYKKRPELYFKKNEQYSNKHAREKTMESIRQCMLKYRDDITVMDIRKKINNLRSQFHSELRKIKKSNASEEVYTPKVWWFESLQFLRKARPYMSNIDLDDQQLTPTIVQVVHEPEAQLFIEVSDPLKLDEPHSTMNDIQQYLKVEMEEQLPENQEKSLPGTSSAHAVEDDAASFGKIVAHHLRRFPDASRLRIQQRILDILIDHEG